MMTVLAAVLALSPTPGPTGVSCKVDGVSFTATDFDLMLFSRPDTVGDGKGHVDKAAKYGLTLKAESGDYVEIIFATDWGMKIDGYELKWKACKFNTPLYQEQTFPGGARVGRGFYSVNYYVAKKSDFVSEDLALALAIGKQSGKQIGFSIDMRIPGGGFVRGSGVAPFRSL